MMRNIIKLYKRLVLNEFKMRKICCEVDLFDSGDKFIALGEEITKYRIVFLDINMEGINGIDTVKEIRKEHRNYM